MVAWFARLAHILRSAVKSKTARSGASIAIVTCAVVIARRWLAARRLRHNLALLEALRTNTATNPLIAVQHGLEDLVSSDGFTALHIACRTGDHKSAAAILDKAPGLLHKSVAGQPGMLPLHCAATHGSSACVRLLLEADADSNALDSQGISALMIAANHGHEGAARALLAAPGTQKTLQCSRGLSALHYAVMAGFRREAALGGETIAGWLVQQVPEACCLRDHNGLTALVIAAQLGVARINVLKLLAGRGGVIDAAGGNKLTALMVAAKHGNGAAVSALLDAGADVQCVDGFGQTAAHLAARHGRVAACKALCSSNAALWCRDDDGDLAIHTAIRSLENERSMLQIVQDMLVADPELSNAADFSDATPLHAAVRAEPAPLALTELLLRSGADVSRCDETGWNSIHYARKAANPAIEAALCENAPPEACSAAPERQVLRKYFEMRGAQHRLPVADREAVLGGKIGLEAIAERLRVEGARVVVMCGAGISTASGIPDYRSEAGLWASEENRDIFANFGANPDLYWKTANKVFAPDRYQPCTTHRFIRLLEQQGKLLRCYTQNIDGLELAAGVSPERLVQCHGSHQTARCSKCSLPEPQMPRVWAAAERGQAARCRECQGPIRPDVVFFGEGLPSKVQETRVLDFEQCSCLIVMGTTLQVYPFAGFVNDVSMLVPRLLINKEEVGPWRVGGANPNQYRDVKHIGGCDEGCSQLAELMGLGAELKHSFGSDM